MINITLITTLLSSSLPAGSAQAAATFRDNAKGAMPAATGVSFKVLATSNAQTKTKSDAIEMGPSVLDPYTKERALSKQEQAELTAIFGVTPVTEVILATPEKIGSGVTHKYFDENGHYIGREYFNGSTRQHAYYDKDGKKIDTNSNTEIQPPVPPDKNEKDIRVWIKHIKDLISYLFKKFDLQKSSTLIKSWTNA
ncbi:MAG: hypothetical protein PHS64_02115 [Candidatus Omnitrophica bacterium]|nr:hypothetical protein [Candidatus Omnitrophota bacterium]